MKTKQIILIIILVASTLFSFGQEANELINFKRGELSGIINSKGDTILDAKYQDIWTFTEGFAIIKLNNKYGFVNNKGQELIPCKYTSVLWHSEGLIIVEINGKYGFVNRKVVEVIPCKYDCVELASVIAYRVFIGKTEHIDGHIFPITGKYGFVDNKGKEITFRRYDEFGNGDSQSGLTPVKFYYKWGYINREGEEVINCIYDSAEDFFEGKAKVKQNEEEFYINTKGKKIGGEKEKKEIIKNNDNWDVQFPQYNLVFQSEISPNGKYILQGFSNSIQIWDIKTKKILQILNNPGVCEYARWSPDSKKIASFYDINRDYTFLCVFDVETGKMLYNFDKTIYGFNYYDNPWTSDSKKILFVEGNIPETDNPAFKVSSVLFNIETGRREKVFNSEFCLVPNKDEIVRLNENGVIEQININTKQLVYTIQDSVKFNSFSYSPNGKYLLVKNNEKIIIIDAKTRKEILKIDGKYNFFMWSENSKQFSITKEEDENEIWDVKSRKKITIVYDPLWGSNNKNIVFYDETKKALKTINIATKQIDTLLQIKGFCFFMNYLDKTNIIISGGSSGGLYDDYLKIIDIQTHNITDLITIKDSDLLQNAEWGNNKIFCTNRGAFDYPIFYNINYLTNKIDTFNFQKLSPKITYKAIIYTDSVNIYKTSTGELIQSIPVKYFKNLSWSQNEEIICLKMSSKTKFYNIKTGEIISSFYNDRYNKDGKYFFSTNNKMVASFHAKTNVITVKDFKPQNDIISFNKHLKSISSLQENNIPDKSIIWSPNNDKILALVNDFTAYIYDIETGELLNVLGWEIDINNMSNTKLNNGHTNIIRKAKWSSDGKKIATFTRNEIKIWDAITGKCLKTKTFEYITPTDIDFNNGLILSVYSRFVIINNINTDTELLRMYINNKDSFFMKTPEGYFDGTKDFLDNLYLVKGMKTKKIGKYYESHYIKGLLNKVMQENLNK